MTTNTNTPTLVFAPSVRMHHATRAKAARLLLTLTAEYPRLTLIAVEGDEIDHEAYDCELAGFAVMHDEDAEVATWTGTKCPELADVLDAALDFGLTEDDLTGEDEDEPEYVGGSVVKEAYRQRYAEASSNGQGNGDFLHEYLVDQCTGIDGFLIESFSTVLRENGIEPEDTNWGNSVMPRNRGWQGRFRMSGRLALEKKIALTGVLMGFQGPVTGPEFDDFLAAMRAKHATAIAKAEKAAAKAAKAAEEAAKEA